MTKGIYTVPTPQLDAFDLILVFCRPKGFPRNLDNFLQRGPPFGLRYGGQRRDQYPNRDDNNWPTDALVLAHVAEGHHGQDFSMRNGPSAARWPAGAAVFRAMRDLFTPVFTPARFPTYVGAKKLSKSP